MLRVEAVRGCGSDLPDSSTTLDAMSHYVTDSILFGA